MLWPKILTVGGREGGGGGGGRINGFQFHICNFNCYLALLLSQVDNNKEDLETFVYSCDRAIFLDLCECDHTGRA
jgi:hypothetical protein